MLKIVTFLSCLILLWNQAFILPALAQTTATNFYVNGTTGLDTNVGTIALPFKTIQRCATVARSGSTCNIAEGVYRETVTPISSGVTFLGTGNAIVSGADLIPASSWALESGNIYRTALGWSLNTRSTEVVSNNQVFFGNQMLPEARFPNFTDIIRVTRPAALPGRQEDFLRATAGDATDYTGYYEHPNLSGLANFTNAGKISFNPGFRNVGTTCDVTSKSGVRVNFQCNPDPAASGNRVPMTAGDGTNSGLLKPAIGEYFELWGRREYLDSAGEWFFDNSNQLSVWLPNNTDPRTSVTPVQIKRRLYAFDLSSKQGTKIRNLTIFASTLKTNSATSNTLVSDSNILYPWHYHESPPFFYTGGTAAIHWKGSNNVIANSYLFGSPGSMVDVSAAYGQPMSNGNAIDNTVIADSGYAANGSAVVGRSTGGRLSQSTSYNNGRYHAQMQKGLDILANDLYNSHLQISDLGVVYGWGEDGVTAGRNTRITGNWVHDAYAELDPSLLSNGAHGIFPDDDVTGFDISRNIVWNTTSDSYLIASTDPNNTQNTGKTSLNINLVNNTGEKYGYLVKNINGTPGIMGGLVTKNNIFSKQGSLPSVPPENGVPDVSNNFLGNPGFLSPARADYRLATTSPAINTGVSVGTFTTGFVGTAPDIGAIESPNRLPTPGALVRQQDLADIRVNCIKAMSTSTTATCTLSNLPPGRKAGSTLGIRVGAAIGTNFTNIPNYTTHQGEAVLALSVPSASTGNTAIALRVGTGAWVPKGTSNLSGTTITAVTPNSGASGTTVTISGTQFNSVNTVTRAIAIRNPTANPLSDYQVPLTIDTQSAISSGKMRSDGGDIRLVDSSSSPVDYWVESGLNTPATRIWVKVPVIVANGTANLTLSYGNPALTSQSDPKKVFIQYADLTQGDPGYLTELGTTVAGVSTSLTSEGVVVSGTPDSSAQYGTWGVRLDPSKKEIHGLPPSYAIDAVTSVTQGTAGAKISTGGFDSSLSIQGAPYGSPSTKMVGNWNGSAWVAAGKSRVGTATFANKRTTYAISTSGGVSNLSWFEDGDTQNILAYRAGVSNPGGHYFHYSPYVLSPFRVVFHRFWIRAFNPLGVEPSVAIGTELSNPIQVRFGTVPATGVVFQGNSQVRAIVPAQPATSPKLVPVQAVNSDGSNATLNNAFTYP
jgi:hypothetical protein